MERLASYCRSERYELQERPRSFVKRERLVDTRIRSRGLDRIVDNRYVWQMLQLGEADYETDRSVLLSTKTISTQERSYIEY